MSCVTFKDLKCNLEGIEKQLKIAADETTLAHLALDLAEESPAWRKHAADSLLEYVVNLDGVLAALQRERQRLLAYQMEAAVAF